MGRRIEIEDRHVRTCTCDVIDNLMYSNLISVVNFALAHSKLDEITPNFAHGLLTCIICFQIFFVRKE